MRCFFLVVINIHLPNQNWKLCDAMGVLLRTTLQWHPHTRICQCWNGGFSAWRRVTPLVWDFHYWHEKRSALGFSHANHQALYTCLFYCVPLQPGQDWHKVAYVFTIYSHPGLHLWHLVFKWHVSTYVNHIAPSHSSPCPLKPSF